ncbi:MAG: hypothetical protein WCV82_04025 [Candidatus Paceibacterota bacterium]|jgi:hypothetical protein
MPSLFLLAYYSGRDNVDMLAVFFLTLVGWVTIVITLALIRDAKRGYCLFVSDLKLHEDILVVEVWDTGPHYRAIIKRQDGGPCQFITIRENERDSVLKKGYCYRLKGDGKLVSVNSLV